MGVILWHKIAFEQPRMTVSNDVLDGDFVLDADVQVDYGVEKPGIFHAEIPNLPLEKSRALAQAIEGSEPGPDGGIPVSIELGYLDGGPKAAVVTGRADRVWTEESTGMATVVEGYERAAFRMVKATRASRGGPPTSISNEGKAVTTTQVVKEILAPAGLEPAGLVSPADVTFSTISMVGENTFDLLEAFAKRVGAEILIQDGQALFGTAVAFPLGGPLPAVPDPSALARLLTAEDSLITIDPVGTGRLAEFKPLVFVPTPAARTAVERPPRETVHAFDFKVLGMPGLRAGQLVVATVADYADPFNAFRIVDLRHSYSRRSGYVCTGRAIRFALGAGPGVNRELTQLGRRASAAGVVARLRERSEAARVAHPSIDVGRLKTPKPDERVATFYYPQERTVTEATPSVDADISEQNAQVFDKPVMSPFAWHKVGLSVPLYPGMRAMLAQRHDLREDAIAAGFLWANKPAMERPKAKDGDWWLCLPTKLGGDGLPTGSGANDLTAADGRRVIEAPSLNLRVGQKVLSDVGVRPSEAPADQLVIHHTSETKITIDAQGAVEVNAKQPIKLVSGGVTLTVGNGKVTVS
jgi:hypothetical protein